jgi:hypothetical protein
MPLVVMLELFLLTWVVLLGICIFPSKTDVPFNPNGLLGCSLLEDIWDHGFLKLSFPQLFSFAKNDKVSLFNLLTHHDVAESFHLTLSMVYLKSSNSSTQYLARGPVFSRQKYKTNGHTFG